MSTLFREVTKLSAAGTSQFSTLLVDQLQTTPPRWVTELEPHSGAAINGGHLSYITRIPVIKLQRPAWHQEHPQVIFPFAVSGGGGASQYEAELWLHSALWRAESHFFFCTKYNVCFIWHFCIFGFTINLHQMSHFDCQTLQQLSIHVLLG